LAYWFSASELLVKGKRLLRLYSYYSLLLALLLLVATSIDQDHVLIGALEPDWVLTCCVLYVFFAAVFSASASLKPDPQIATGYIFFEIVLLNIIMFASGGLNSGLLSIIAIPVVISNLLTPNVLGYGVAAWTSITVIYMQNYLAQDTDAQALLNSGLYGFLCFILAWGTQNLSKLLKSALSSVEESNSRLKSFQRFSQQALLHLPDAIIVCDKEDKALFFNNKATLWFAPKENQKIAEELLAAIEKGQLQNEHGVFYIRKTRPIDNTQGYYLLSIEDSKRITQEAQQFKLASLGRLTASIAHEIRNPLSAMRQAAQILNEKVEAESDNKKLTQIIEQNSLRINRIIEDMLQLARRKETSSKVLDLNLYLTQFKQQFQSHQAGIKLTVQCQKDTQVFFDSNHLQQVLINLCSNAARYAIQHSGQDAQIYLNATTIGDYIQLDINDNGGGLNAQQRNLVFEPFYTSENNGTGLGLYVCKELCEANQASIHYLDIPNGACFRLLLRKA
jgi:two-component system sensor histidine kinase PilS (NtrC family)